MDTLFSFKELYNCILKSTYSMNVGSREIEPGEVLCSFDHIQLANFKEVVSSVSASGGYGNQARITWENVKGINLTFSQGIFSKEQLALLSNSSLITSTDEDPFLVSYREELETNEEGIFEIKHTPNGKLFIYDCETGKKIKDSEQVSETQFKITEAYKDIVVDYEYIYDKTVEQLKIGLPLTGGFLSLEARTKIQEDTTGIIRSGILKVPKLKLVSDLTITLGKSSAPTIATFKAVGHPSGVKGRERVMELTFLEEDIDSDI